MVNKRKKTVRRVISGIVLLCMLFALGFLGGRGVLKVLYPMKYEEFVEVYASQYEIDKNLLYAVIETESGFDKDAVSSMGALGLTQILPETFTWLQSKTGESLETDELFNPEVSIKYAAVFYKMLMNEYKNVRTAAAAYHAGMGCVGGWLGDSRYSSDGKTLDSIPYRSTAAYVEKIVKTMSIYDKLY